MMKKVISVLVALMMLLSVFSVSAFAAVNDAVLAIRVTPTATTYPAGEVVTFEVSYESTSEIGKVGACTLHIGYDNTVFEPVEDLGTGLKLSEATKEPVVLSGYALEGKVSADNSFVQTKGALAAADTAKGWNETLKIALTGTGTLFEATTEVKVLAFKLKVKDNAASGNYTVGVTQGSIEDYSTQVVEELGPISGPSGADYEFSVGKIFDLYDATLAVEGSGSGGEGGDTPDPTPTVTVSNSDTKVKWSDKANGKIYIGFEGVLTGFTPVTEVKDGRTEVTNIGSVGFRFSTTDATLASGSDVAARTLYDFNDGTYKFRAIVETDYNSESRLYATAYIKLEANGNATLTSDTIISTSVAAEYAEATGKGLPAFGA